MAPACLPNLRLAATRVCEKLKTLSLEEQLAYFDRLQLIVRTHKEGKTGTHAESDYFYGICLSGWLAHEAKVALKIVLHKCMYESAFIEVMLQENGGTLPWVDVCTDVHKVLIGVCKLKHEGMYGAYGMRIQKLIRKMMGILVQSRCAISLRPLWAGCGS